MGRHHVNGHGCWNASRSAAAATRYGAHAGSNGSGTVQRFSFLSECISELSIALRNECALPFPIRSAYATSSLHIRNIPHLILIS